MKLEVAGPRLGALRAPVVVAPMSDLSGPELAVASCRAGLVGSFPAVNARTVGELRRWLTEVTFGLGDVPDPRWAVGVIVHRCYDRFEAELELLAEFRPSFVLTALGSPRRVVDAVRDYGGEVFAGVGSVEHALKAVDAGADGLVLECPSDREGSGPMSPQLFVEEVRGFFGGPLAVSAALTTGRGVREVENMGADLAYVGSRFTGCPEVRRSARHRDLVARVREDGVAATAAMTGVPCSWLAESIDARGFARAGAAAGGTGHRPSAAEVAERIVEEYRAAAFDSAIFEPAVLSPRLAAPRGASE
jgi:nitronate monooxygenase